MTMADYPDPLVALLATNTVVHQWAGQSECGGDQRDQFSLLMSGSSIKYNEEDLKCQSKTYCTARTATSAL